MEALVMWACQTVARPRQIETPTLTVVPRANILSFRPCVLGLNLEMSLSMFATHSRGPPKSVRE